MMRCQIDHDSQRKVSIGFLICFLLFILGTFTGQATQILLPKSPKGQVWMKQVPQFQIISVEIKGDPFRTLDEIDLKLNRYVASAGFEIIKPLVIEFPDLDWQPNDERPLFIYLPLPREDVFNPSKDDSLHLDIRDSNRVASIAFNGAYTLQNIQPYFKQMKNWLQETKNIVTGTPRLLLYHHRAFRFDFMREAELQIPIR